MIDGDYSLPFVRIHQYCKIDYSRGWNPPSFIYIRTTVNVVGFTI